MAADKTKICEWVKDLINSKTVLVFSKSYCPYCQRAIAELKKLNLKNMHIEQIENNPQLEIIQDVLQDITGKRTVPRIFINKEIVGGSDDLLREINEGTLKKRLIAAGEM